MRPWHSKICALVLILTMTPAFGEVMENAAHLLAEGHLAHVAADGDRHDPPGDEHGCTPIFHFCGCHASLSFMSSRAPSTSRLRVVGFSRPSPPDPQLTAFWPSVDRPPQA